MSLTEIAAYAQESIQLADDGSLDEINTRISDLEGIARMVSSLECADNASMTAIALDDLKGAIESLTIDSQDLQMEHDNACAEAEYEDSFFENMRDPSPEEEAGWAFQDRYDMYRNEY